MNVGELLIRISADTSGLRGDVREARREIDRLPDEHRIRIIIDQNGGGGGRGGIAGAARNMGDLRVKMAAVASLAPILAAGIQVVVGAVGGLVSMLGDATIGTVSFGAVATAVLNDVIDAQKEIVKAQEDMKKALTDDEKQTALENMAKAYRGLSEEQLAAVYSLQRFKSFWDDYTESFEKPVVIAFAKALEGFQYFIEKLRPTVAAAGDAIIKVFDAANAAMKGADFTRFFDALSKSVGPVLETFGYVSIDVFQGLLNIMTAFKPVSGAMQSGIRGISQAFLQWTQSLNGDKIKEFMDFVIQVGPQFITTLTSLGGIIVDIIKLLTPMGVVMIGITNVLLALVNVAIKAFNWFTAMALGWDSARTKADALKNSVTGLWNSIKVLLGFKSSSGSGSPADSIFDIDKAWQDWFGSIGDVTGGLKDAQKASDGFLASFDEVHSIKGDDGGGLTAPEVPKAPSIPTTPGNPWNQPEMDEPQAGGSNWIQNLIDKLKELAMFFPFKMSFEITPPDGGAGAIAVAWEGAMVRTLASTSAIHAAAFYMTGAVSSAVTTSASAIQLAWHTMLDYMQAQINAYNPYIMFQWETLRATLELLIPSTETIQAAWHSMLDYMQSQINAYEPYISWGITLVAQALSALEKAQSLLETAWNASWKNMYNTMHTRTSAMIDDFRAVQQAFMAMQATIGQSTSSYVPIQGHQAGGNQPVMDDVTGSPVTSGNSISELLKNFDYGEFFKDKTASLGEFGIDAALTALGAKGVQITSAIVKEVAEGAVAGRLKTVIESILSRRQITDTAARQRPGMEDVSGFATGGIIGSDSIVRVGEKGRREAIIPLETSAMMPFASAIASSMGGSGGGDIILQIDGTTFARLIAPYGVKESQRIGGSMIQTT